MEQPARAANERRFHRFLSYYYLATASYEFIFAYAIYTIFFNLRGMSIFQISMLMILWCVSSLVLEVPTGALADTWSRRKMMALAPLIKSLCFVAWFYAGHNFWLFALGFGLWSLGSSFKSGTSEALLYDTHVYYGKTTEYEKTISRQRFYLELALGFSVISGGFIAAYRMDLAILLSVVPLLFSAVIAWQLEDTPRTELRAQVHYWQHMRLAFREIARNRLLIYLIVYAAAVDVFGALEEYDQLYYRLVGIPIAIFGIISFAYSMLSALTARIAYRLKGYSFIFYLLPFISGLMLIIVWRYPSPVAIAVYILSGALLTPLGILTEARIQHNITGVSRATVTSAIALLYGIPVYDLPYGLIGNKWQAPALFLAGAIQLLLLAAIVFTKRRHFLREGAGIVEKGIIESKALSADYADLTD
jgi:MFS family permease